MARPLTIWLVAACAFAVASGSSHAKTSTQVVVKAKLTGISNAPRCGDEHTATVMRYKVLSVISGVYTPHTLYAVFDCGEVHGLPNGVRVGDVHRLVAKPLPAHFRAVIFDDFSAEKTPRWLAVHADTATP